MRKIREFQKKYIKARDWPLRSLAYQVPFEHLTVESRDTSKNALFSTIYKFAENYEVAALLQVSSQSVKRKEICETAAMLNLLDSC